MKPRKFFGANSREVLKQVREVLGPDALIVSNAKVAGGIEVIALPSSSLNDIVGTAAPTTAAAINPSPSVTTPTTGSREAKVAEATMRPFEMRAPAAQERTSRAAPIAPSPAQAAAAGREGTAPMRDAPAAAATPAAPTTSASSISDAAIQGMLAELRSMRAVLEQRLFGLAWTELSRREPAKVSALQSLLTAGFSAELARRLTEPMPDGVDEQEGTRWLVAEINRNLLTAGNDNDIIDRGGVYAIVGPTGVGKTTTTAKLAARGVVRHGADRVALLTTDTYRIGAHEQLRIYGRILGVTTSVVRDADELKAALSELRGKHMVLIDTIGMSQRDKMVAEQVSALARCGGNVKRLLLLNATCNGETLDDVVRCYDPSSLDGCILTKLDEAQSIGASIDVVIRNRLTLHFVANGQRVPEDLHAPNRHYLIHRALRASPAGESSFGLASEEFPLVLASNREAARAQAANEFAGRLGAYLG